MFLRSDLVHNQMSHLQYNNNHKTSIIIIIIIKIWFICLYFLINVNQRKEWMGHTFLGSKLRENFPPCSSVSCCTNLSSLDVPPVVQIKHPVSIPKEDIEVEEWTMDCLFQITWVFLELVYNYWTACSWSWIHCGWIMIDYWSSRIAVEMWPLSSHASNVHVSDMSDFKTLKPIFLSWPVQNIIWCCYM
jgi:hypothetical protein